MTGKLSRRGFLHAAGVGAAATAVLTGCGPASRYVVREPYVRMPEYTYNGFSTYYATTCRECPAGCGTVVRTEQGRALKVEGNPHNPINQGKTCSRGQAALQGLYNPDRILGPVKQTGRGSWRLEKLTWDDAVAVVQKSLQENQPGETVFLMGLTPDHLFDLVSELTSAMSAPPPLRHGAHAIFDGTLTLRKASQQIFSKDSLPYFDLANADVTFSFGANFLETYQSPMAYSRGFARMRRGKTGTRGYLVQFEPRLSQTAACADEWIPIAPGSEGLVAMAIGRLVAEIRRVAIPAAYLNVVVEDVALISGIASSDLHRLADIFINASHPLAIPGGGASGSSNGLESAQAVLALNAMAGNLGKAGGMYFNPVSPVSSKISTLPASFADLNGLIGRMKQGAVKTLFVHGINPVFELPAGLGFQAALAAVPQVISFSSYPDETAMQADYIFPDHTGLESWGYQRPQVGVDRVVISGFQPVVSRYYDTRATADVLLAAVQAIGGDLAEAIPYTDEVDFLQAKLNDLVTLQGFYSSPEIKSFMAKFQQFGGWWDALPNLQIPAGTGALSQVLSASEPTFSGQGEYTLHPYLSPILGDGSGANKPWLQETPDPTTTVMWNSWVEINPATADSLGLEDDDIIKVISPIGTIEVAVYRYPAIRPDTIAIPFGQGHTAYGQYARGRGVNPGDVLSLVINGADELAHGATRVQIQKTGRKQVLSRLESRMGVYGE